MGDLRSTAKSPEDKSLNVWNKVSGQKRFYKPQRPEGVRKTRNETLLRGKIK